MRHFVFAALICISLGCKKDPSQSPPTQQPAQESAVSRYVALFGVPASMGLEGASEGAKCVRSRQQPPDPGTTHYACGSLRAAPFIMRPHDPTICEQRDMNIPTGFYELPYPTWIESVDSTPCRSGWLVTVGTEAEVKRRQDAQRRGPDPVPVGPMVRPSGGADVPPAGVIMLQLMSRLQREPGRRPVGAVVEMRRGGLVARCTVTGPDSSDCSSGGIESPRFALDAGVRIEQL